MKTAADYRRAELRRKLQRAEIQAEYWYDLVRGAGLATVRRIQRDNAMMKKWTDIARILRRTLREEEGKGTR